MPINRDRVRSLLQEFKFTNLFIEEMGWSRVQNTRPVLMQVKGNEFTRTPIAQMSGVMVFEIAPAHGKAWIPDSKLRRDVYNEVEKIAHENLLIFVDSPEREKRTQSLWYWMKREGNKKSPREHLYLKGQPGDLFLSKLDSMVIDLDELRQDGTIPITEVTSRMAASLDVERVTKRFYNEFSSLRVEFIDLIEGIEREADRFWYASVLLNRLMFVYFLQKKGFIQGNTRYLDEKLHDSKKRGADRYYSEFLKLLFFEGFAKPLTHRSPEAKALLGDIRYLNGGLFLPHQLELDNPNIHIPDEAFENVLALFGRYSWHLDDAPGAQDNEINPDVLGYIFEKYINQKAFGAYYTRTEITNYLCERTINAVIVDKVNDASQRQYQDIGDILLKLDAELCRTLLVVLPTISILDPACGSGAFLVAAMKTLLDIYAAVFGKIEFLSDPYLTTQIRTIRAEHSSVNYYIRKRIITDNLYGVDIMEEATEIARLRLFLFLVSAAQTVEQLEPLPNIDFNIMSGNSLIGLLHVDPERFDSVGQSMSMLERAKAENYKQALREKNLKLSVYRDPDNKLPNEVKQSTEALTNLREQIEDLRLEAYETLNDILLDDFRTLKIQYEQAQPNGKAKKRRIELSDVEVLQPFHWGYDFDEIIGLRGGFDVIVANPPWEIFKPNSKEFFAEYSDVVTKKNMRIEDFDKEQERLLKEPEIEAAWLDYLSRFPHVSSYYRSALQFINQISIVNGKKAGTDINLYKLFTEQSYNLLRPGGRCGIVIPSGIYSDLGAKQLRELLFSSAEIQIIFGLSNERFLFEGVDHRFKIALLVFEKGGQTNTFEAAFRINPREAISPEQLDSFLHAESQHLTIDVSFIRRTSPDSLSVMELKNSLDVVISEKMLRFPLLGEDVTDTWSVKLHREFDMTNDSHLFHASPAPDRLPLYEGKMISQFSANYAEPRYWVDEKQGRKAVIGVRGKDNGQDLDYCHYRIGYRAIARNSDTRTLIVSVLPKKVFCGNSLLVSDVLDENHNLVLSSEQILLITAMMNTMTVDYFLRQLVSANINMFYLYQLPIPRLSSGDPNFAALIKRAAHLICTTEDFDELAKDAGIDSHHSGVHDPIARLRLRAEIDAIVAHIYKLTEAEFVHVLSTFSLVSEPDKVAAQNAYRDVERGLIL